MFSELAKGIFLMFASTFFFALMNAIVKYLTSLGYSSMENIFFRAFFMVLAMWLLFCSIPAVNRLGNFNFKRPNLYSKKKGGVRKILLRSFFGAISMSLAFYNFATIPLGISTAFLQSMPIFMVIFTFFTKERPNLFSIFATLIGFTGVLLVANPNTSQIPIINAVAGIVGAMSAAFAFMTLRSLKEYYQSGAVVLWYGISMSVVGILGMLLPIEKMGGFIMPNFFDLLLFVMAGVIGTIGQWLMTKSYMFAPASVIAPISYMRIVWSLFLGFYLGDAFPNLLTLSGISLIIFSGILIALPSCISEWRRIKNKN
ncbi:DMT family transporter [Helicobacter monodelphidis]|uniref:DMT family transporter n=1 Tax=Helicobacter sp. 15-1451 TaxID=2004995 RepID=UPI0015EB2B10|nr:DMT family transporter [Helicobacter sp. 15-1451]